MFTPEMLIKYTPDGRDCRFSFAFFDGESSELVIALFIPNLSVTEIVTNPRGSDVVTVKFPEPGLGITKS